MNDYRLIHRLAVFQQTADRRKFQKVFGMETGEHLWGKYNKLKGNLLYFWGVLDSDNREKLLNHINK